MFGAADHRQTKGEVMMAGHTPLLLLVIFQCFIPSLTSCSSLSSCSRPRLVDRSGTYTLNTHSAAVSHTRADTLDTHLIILDESIIVADWVELFSGKHVAPRNLANSSEH